MGCEYWKIGNQLSVFNRNGNGYFAIKQYCYRAMHFSAKCGIAIACRLSVRPSARPSVCPWRWWIV